MTTMPLAAALIDDMCTALDKSEQTIAALTLENKDLRRRLSTAQGENTELRAQLAWRVNR